MAGNDTRRADYIYITLEEAHMEDKHGLQNCYAVVMEATVPRRSKGTGSLFQAVSKWSSAAHACESVCRPVGRAATLELASLCIMQPSTASHLAVSHLTYVYLARHTQPPRGVELAGPVVFITLQPP